MSLFVIVMIAVLVLALLVGVLVAVGMQGYYRDRNPQLAKKLNKAARYLNGDAEPNSFRQFADSQH